MLSVYAVTEKGAHKVPVCTSGSKKTHVTVMLLCTVDGRKLPPYVAFKHKTKCMPKENFPKRVIVCCDEKGWMNKGLVLDSVKTVWCLILDVFHSHLVGPIK